MKHQNRDYSVAGYASAFYARERQIPTHRLSEPLTETVHTGWSSAHIELSAWANRMHKGEVSRVTLYDHNTMKHREWHHAGELQNFLMSNSNEPRA